MSAWGKSWGLAFGAAFGVVVAPPIEPPVIPIVQIAAIGGGGTSMADWNEELQRQQKRQIQEEDELVITAIAQLIATGALG